MNSKIRIIVTICICGILVCVFALIHEATRMKVPEQTIAVDDESTVTYVHTNDFALSAIRGQVTNGSGAVKDIEGQGILLRDVLSMCQIEDYPTVRVISDDEYAAELSEEEIKNTDNVYLLIEDGEARLYVFGDSNSKRNVSRVKRISIERSAS